MEPWNKANNKFKRRSNILKIRQRILIVCEGSKTEPKYFKKFPVNTQIVDIEVDGTGYNTLSLVNKAITMKEEAEKTCQPYNQVWCVFDRDSFDADNFDNAITRAYSNKIKVAYSNEAFELWYLLHFEFYNTGISRDRYKQLLSTKINALTKGKITEYHKNDDDIYKMLHDKQQTAINNARRLNSRYSDNCFSRHNPRTTVFLLVEELNKYI